MMNQHEKAWLLLGAIILSSVATMLFDTLLAGLTFFGISAWLYATWHYRRRKDNERRMKNWEMIDNE